MNKCGVYSTIFLFHIELLCNNVDKGKPFINHQSDVFSRCQLAKQIVSKKQKNDINSLLLDLKENIYIYIFFFNNPPPPFFFSSSFFVLFFFFFREWLQFVAAWLTRWTQRPRVRILDVTDRIRRPIQYVTFM